MQQFPVWLMKCFVGVYCSMWMKLSLCTGKDNALYGQGFHHIRVGIPLCGKETTLYRQGFCFVCARSCNITRNCLQPNRRNLLLFSPQAESVQVDLFHSANKVCRAQQIGSLRKNEKKKKCCIARREAAAAWSLPGSLTLSCAT